MNKLVIFIFLLSLSCVSASSIWFNSPTPQEITNQKTFYINASTDYTDFSSFDINIYDNNGFFKAYPSPTNNNVVRMRNFPEGNYSFNAVVLFNNGTNISSEIRSLKVNYSYVETPKRSYTICLSGCDFTNFQTAINNTENDSIFYIKNGTYPGFIIQNRKNVSFIGESKEGVLINSSGIGCFNSTAECFGTFIFNSAELKLANLTFLEGKSNLWIEAVNNSNFTNIESKFATNFTGIMISSTANLVFYKLNSYKSNIGMIVLGSKNISINEANFSMNTNPEVNLFVSSVSLIINNQQINVSSSNITITNSNFYNNTGYAIRLENVNNSNFRANFISNNKKGIYLLGENNIFVNSIIKNNEIGIFADFQESSNTNIFSNNIFGNLCDMKYASSSACYDLSGPAKTEDLRIRIQNRIDATRFNVILEWTAPGNNENYGNASSYEVRYSMTGEINESNWNSALLVSQSLLWVPKSNGTLESKGDIELNAPAVWFALRAKDDNGQISESSNSPLIVLRSMVRVSNLSCVNARTNMTCNVSKSGNLNTNYLFDTINMRGILTNTGSITEIVELKAKYNTNNNQYYNYNLNNTFIQIAPGESINVTNVQIKIPQSSILTGGRVSLINERNCDDLYSNCEYIPDVKVYSIKDNTTIDFRYNTTHLTLQCMKILLLM